MNIIVGQRIRIHPASDWFMRGIVYATVTSIRFPYGPDNPRIYLKAQNIGLTRLRIKLPVSLLMTMDGEVIV